MHRVMICPLVGRTPNKQRMSVPTSAPDVVADLLRRAEAAGASDVHLQMTGPDTGATVGFRLDGVLVPVTRFEAELAERVFGRIKFLARLKTYQESLPQDGRINKADSGTQHDLRVATYPTVTGEKIVLRLFQGAAAATLGELGFPAKTLAELERFLSGQAGMLLLTGPAGSGKTTTIYACLRHLAGQGGRHIITVEDPVEQVLPGVMQTEVNEARGLTFAVAARHLLRQDPQVLVLGEIRDDETASLAVRAALTGHLVVSTLHAGSCQGVFERLLLMGPDAHAVTAAVELVLNQRLLRRLCGACAGKGCAECLETGYRGRLPIVESVRMDEALRRELRRAGPDVIAPGCRIEGAAREVLARGLSDDREYARVFGQGPEPILPR